MAIDIGTTRINSKFLGGLALNKIMLGAIEIFPNIDDTPPGDFDPSDLFVGGGLGLFYNFNQSEWIFQTLESMQSINAGGQPIGVVADGSMKFALGAELVPNNTFATGWTVFSATVVGGELVSNNTANQPLAQQAMNTPWVLGALYEFTIVLSAYESGAVFASDIANNVAPFGVSGVGTHKQYFVCRRADSSTIRLTCISTGFIGTVASFSAKRVDSNTASQATAAARAAWGMVGAGFGGVFDGVDDGLASVPIDFSTSDTITVFMGGTRRSTSRAYAYGLEPAYSGNTFSKRMPEGGTTSQHYWARYANGVLQFVNTTQNVSVPETFVDSCVFTYVPPASPASVSIKPTLNGSVPPNNGGSGAGTGGATFFENNQITIGKTLANANPCNMDLAYIVIINRECTPEEHAQMNAWGSALLGITP